MAAAAPWTVRVRERAVEAKARCDHARGLLRGAVSLLASPMHIADAPGGRARAKLVVDVFIDAFRGLAFAAVTTGAAELHALRAAAADPRDPLPSVADIPVAQHIERTALGMLREARSHAEVAYDAVGWSCDRLLTAYNLLDHPGLPGVDGFIDAERAAARRYLMIAENLAGLSATYAYNALVVPGA